MACCQRPNEMKTLCIEEEIIINTKTTSWNIELEEIFHPNWISTRCVEME